MKQPKKNTQNVKIILLRLKRAAGLTTDTALADALQVAPATLGNWKKRQSLDYTKVFTYCESVGLSLDYVVFGEEQKNGFPEKNVKVDETAIDKTANIESLLIDLLSEKVKDHLDLDLRAMQSRIDSLEKELMMPKIQEALKKLDQAIEKKEQEGHPVKS